MKKILLLITACLVLAHSMQAATYYVSKSGSDSNAGTSTNLSFLTIQKAASLMTAGDTCYILSGTYRETVIPAHSGTSSSRMTFTAYHGAVPIVSGADVLNLSWSVYSNSIYQATTLSSFRQLFVDGVMMNEARWPNAAVNNLLYAPRSTPSVCDLTDLTDSALPNVNLVGTTLQIFPNEYNNPGYAANTRTITGWDSTTKTISWSGDIFNAGAPNCFYYVYGALGLLDIPTEWYLSSGSPKKLYLWTPDGASPATHVVEVKIRSNAFTFDNRSYITVSGIYVFAAGISMANTVNCVVDGCSLMYVQHNTTADWTVNVPIANQVSGSGSMWINSTINFSSQDGIRCTGQNEIISNCVIQQVDYYPGTYYAAVTTYDGANGTKIVNNTLTYSGRYCVGSSSQGNEIAYNDLGYGDLLTSDGGGTYEYANGTGGGTTLHHNWVHNCWAGVYVDQDQNDYVIYRNVCYSNYIGMLFNKFTNDLIINNTSVSNISKDIQFGGASDVNVSLINNIWNTSQNSYGVSIVKSNGWYPPLGTNYVPLAGSGAIDHGVVYSPYTDGYVGAGPDIGAYEMGGDYWVPGANFTPQAFPNPYESPSILTPPASVTNIVSQTAVLSVTAAGAQPLSYQWQAGTVGSGVYTNLITGGQYSDVTSPTLYITNLGTNNAADFIVVVSNSVSSVISPVATLTVLAASPSIAVQPLGQTNIVGQSATLTVTALGLPTLSYQWQSGATGSGVYTNLLVGGQFTGVTNSTLSITNLVAGNAGDYVVVASNSYGSITSSIAELIVFTNSAYHDTVVADHAVSYWPLNETSGTLIHDTIGNNNGTCMNTDGLTLGGPGILYVQGVTSDTAIYFGNTNSGYINVPYSSTLNTPKFTVEVWLNMPTFPVAGAGPDMNPLSFEDFNPKGWTFEISSPNGANPNMYGWLGNNSWATINSGTCIQGQWSYYALTYDGTNFSIYVDGTLAANKSASLTQVTSSQSFLMGAYNSGGVIGRFYKGGMENVAFYTNALSAGRILTHYQVGSTGLPPAPPMVSFQLFGTNMIVSWMSGNLQKAASPVGPWLNITNAVSPYTNGMTNSAQFFRSKY